MPAAKTALLIFAALGSGLMGGLLFVFSNVIMKALAQLPPESGIRTMQAINLIIVNPLFLAIFMGTSVAAAVLAFSALKSWSSPDSVALLAGCALYLLGVLGVTILCNVPLNNRFASVAANTVEAAQYWRIYLDSWLRWNHLRTLAAILACAMLIIASRQGRTPAG
jgi:uncharacterized membrane protein